MCMGFDRWEVGTQLLAKVRGWKCHWPVVVWSARLCLRKDMAQLLESHKQGALPMLAAYLNRFGSVRGFKACTLNLPA